MTILSLPDPSAAPDAFLAALRAVDWPAFVPADDLPPLRAALARLEQVHGVTEAHWFATERIRELGALLRHPDGHPYGLTGHALSPCGRYLAVGSWCGDDYDHGGMLQIWELASARCVNVLDGIAGGVGWPYYARTIQWSADGRRIGLAHNTNAVGVWDPFGEEPEPIAEAYVTDGYSRPPAWAFGPDGRRAYIVAGYPQDGQVQGLAVPLVEGEVYDSDDVTWELAELLPDQVRALLDDERFSFDRVFWSRDGRRLYGHMYGWACALDAVSGRVLWFVEAGKSADAPAWSRNERYFAHQLRGQLLVADALTGQTVAALPGHPGASELSWGAHGAVTRLAVVVPDGNDANARPHVTVYDDGRHRYDLDLPLREVRRDDEDASTWAWSPDGLHAAMLTAHGHVEVWSLNAAASRVGTVEAQESARGLVWGADGVIAIVGETTLRFFQAATGRVIGDFAFLRTPPDPGPLELDGDDVGEWVRVAEEASVDPTFALDDETWAVAFEQGTVIAPPGREHDLDGLLAWTVERRFGWPVRWGALDVLPDAASAAERVGPPLAEYLEPFRGRTEPVAEEWPPANTATLDDLFRLVIDAVQPLHEGWDYHVSEGLRHAARLRARRGETDGVQDLLDEIPDAAQQVRGHADVALILAAAGNVDDAHEFFRPVESMAEAVIDEYNTAFVASSVAGALAALGDTARGEAWFARAREAIDPETNPGEHRLAVAWALIECGREDEALALLRQAEENPSVFSSRPLLAYLIRTGRDHLARELIPMRAAQAEEWQAQGWFDGWDAVELCVTAGRPDLLREWARVYGDGYAYEEQLAQAEANAALDPARARPDSTELAALADAHAALMKTPRTQRESPTGRLVLQSAACGHLGAVLERIAHLPEDDFNGRPGHAFRALWIASTGFEVEPW
ncbi:WD40 repeat domain-containing protein [Nonomuraea sp. NPDC049695]|uniref:WD40 repeat domain-containing protein n=1 Tax=Nonomuraea sp. NPDC049695 TaxID=3154734 RepID=UPI003444FBCF